MNGVRPTSGVQDVLALRQEVLTRSKALQDVRAATAPAAPADGGVKAPAGADFADTLGDALQQVSAVQKRSGDMQAAYERGEVTDIAKVMLARQEAGVAFEATLQVRNKLLSAYQSIMRMGS
ncbi:flagellar hook-basal body complex protein FliE [Erythrobacter crassostreae]|uniref:Flagellar hook-basal body complex protein FliE n=1 Tax=Erythrobacter crassostreae TaxID=2828328 RepID=A0A9X1JKD8_9SPHN|nr:flagellar hook-basal body complex protein FliE [Erythrobacter crassostrea]MBV7258925.1 flagellar hook-basal body complex protein FliE [Erythrobacter crassostrea]